MKYVQVFFKKKIRVDAFPLRWAEELTLVWQRDVAPSVVCWWLPVEVGLDELLDAVEALREQILQVPVPAPGILKQTGRS